MFHDTLTNEDRDIAKRGDCVGDINIPDRMMLGDRADYRAMLARVARPASHTLAALAQVELEVSYGELRHQRGK